MSRYSVTTYDPGISVIVGFGRDWPGYFFVAHEEGVVGPIAHSEPNQLLTVHELVRATWALVDWGRELSTLRRLRDDTWKEQAAVSGPDAAVSAVLVQAFQAG